MLLLRRLEVTGFRNLRSVSLSSLSDVNIFYGGNGAGKTSLLESIHLLASAKSFRSHKLAPLVNNKSDKCVSFAEVLRPDGGYQTVGVERYRSNSQSGSIKISGQVVKSVSLLAENLPLQVISSDTFKLLEGGPAVRRQFMDWGVFHVEHRFHAVWKDVQRCLKQRNSLLRHGRIDTQSVEAWTVKLSQFGEILDNFRADYFKQFIPIFGDLLSRLVDLDQLSIKYYRGWDDERSLLSVLEANLDRDSDQGYTTAGPHRADLKLRYQSLPASDVLSRGQQKLVVCALRLAQGFLLSKMTGRALVYLIDDLPAELDKHHRQAFCELLEELECQVFVTCVEYQDVIEYWSDRTGVKLFHVEHGSISETVNDTKQL